MDPIRYNATPTSTRFHLSDAQERWAIGPVGVGKTVAASMELWMRMVRQQPNPVTKRRETKWIAIRESYPQLLSTTIETWMQWAGRFGKLSGQSPITWRCEMRLPDSTILDSTVLFYAMSDNFDTSKLRSLEVTGGFLSEFAEIDKEVIDVLATRFRFPQTKTLEFDGYEHGPTWRGMFGESNAPSANSHWFQRFEVERPEGCEVFWYPPALIREYDAANKSYIYHDNPAAENIAYLPKGFTYYHDMIKSMSDEAIDNLVLNNYGRDMSGRPVFPSFSRERHVVEAKTLQINPNYPVIVGCDPGLNAAAVFTQMTPLGGIAIHDEVVTSNLTFEQFIDEHLIPVLRTDKYRRVQIEVVIDPAALQRTAMSNLTPIAMLRQKGIAARPALTNKLDPRLKAVEHFLNKDGRLLVSDACTKVVAGFSGGYRYARVRGASGRVFKPEPEKNEYSHPLDACQYACMTYLNGIEAQATRERYRAGQRPTGSVKLA